MKDRLTEEQETKFSRTCANCCSSYGSHRAGDFACPTKVKGQFDPALKFRISEVFEAGQEAAHAPQVEDIQPLEIGRRVTWSGRGGRVDHGRIVQIVGADELPVFAGLRHIADKRRQPKARKEISFVVTTMPEGIPPQRASLFWPKEVRYL